MRRDLWTYAGMTVVAVSAAVISFNSLMGLGSLAGIAPPWLLPLSIDGYAVVATRIWLRSAKTPRTATYARRNAYTAIVLSIVGNAAYHGFIASGVSRLGPSGRGWVVAVAVAAVAPGALGLVAHLWSYVAIDAHTDTQAERHRKSRATARGGKPVPVPVVPVEPTRSSGTEPTGTTAPIPDPIPRMVPPAATPDPFPTAMAPQPAASNPGTGDGTARATKMRAYVVQQRSTGASVSGTELAQRFGTSGSYGRKILRELAAQSNGHSS